MLKKLAIQFVLAILDASWEKAISYHPLVISDKIGIILFVFKFCKMTWRLFNEIRIYMSMKQRRRPMLLSAIFSAGFILFLFMMEIPAQETPGNPKLHNSRDVDGELQQKEMPAEETGVRLDEKIGTMLPLDLEFRDESGQLVTLRQLVKGPTIIAPVYYRCPNVCNFMLGGLARVLPDVRRQPGQPFTVLAISFDDTETAELAASCKKMYFKSMRGEFPEAGWRFLTGTKENIYRLTDSAGYYFKNVKGQFMHPVAVFVINSNGQIVRYLHGTHFLPKDVTLALVEAAEGRLGTTIQKMVQFCFSYDPENKTYVFNLLRISGSVVLFTAVTFLGFLFLSGKKGKRG